MKLSGEVANIELDSGSVNVAAASTVPLLISQDINLRVLLGDMYDKYSKFLMIFNGIGGFSSLTGYNTSNGVTNVPQVAVWSCQMSGLDFIQNSYNGVITNSAIFPTKVQLPVNNYAATNNTGLNGVVFQKPVQERTTLSIAFVLTRGGGTAVAANTGGSSAVYDLNLSFTVYGLKDDK